MMLLNTNSNWNLCCIPHCSTNAAGNDNTSIQFYPFPTDPILKEMWIERVRKAGTGNRWYPKISSRLCGKHFSSTGKRESRDILPRYFGLKVYSHSGVISMDEVKVKLELADEDDIEIHEEPLTNEFVDFTMTNVKQEPKDSVEAPSGLVADNHLAPISQNHQHGLLVPLAKIEEKINLIKRDKPTLTSRGRSSLTVRKPPPFIVVKGPPEKELPILTHILDDSNHSVEYENSLLKRQISGLEQSLEKANNMIKERKEIIMNLVKEVNKLKKRTSLQDELKKENEHLQESLIAANRRINEEKELIVNLTIENINLKKVAGTNESLHEHSEKSANEQLDRLKCEMSILCEDISRLTKKNESLVQQNEDMMKEKNSQLASMKKISQSNVTLQAMLTKNKQKVIHFKKELDSCRVLLKKHHWSDNDIKYYTGFHGKSEFEAFCDIAKEIDPSPVSESYDISKIRQQIFITLSRIRHGFSIEDLSLRNEMSQGTVFRILQHWQNILSDSSFNWKICQSHSIIVKFFHEYFQEKHKRRIMCYSVGISPFGYVIFVSDLFSPSANRVEVLKSSKILSLLEEGFTIGALDTNEFSELGIPLLETKPEELADFHTHANKLLCNVRKNKLFSHVLPFEQISDIEVSNAWKISWYLQNYIDEF